MLKKEYLDLVPGPTAELISKSTLLVEEYLVQVLGDENIQLSFDQQPRNILYHGHCQQKAHLGTGNTIQLLEQIPGCSVNELDTTCCGMAGAFGYEKEHYQISLQIAELGLAPLIRKSSPDTIICASGTSCREQIIHTNKRKTVHPLEVFAEALL